MDWDSDEDDASKQAMLAARNYMVEAKHKIDRQFGDGYAAAHPELVGAFMQTAALDLQASVIFRHAEVMRDAVANVRHVLEDLGHVYANRLKAQR